MFKQTRYGSKKRGNVCGGNGENQKTKGTIQSGKLPPTDQESADAQATPPNFIEKCRYRVARFVGGRRIDWLQQQIPKEGSCQQKATR